VRDTGIGMSPEQQQRLFQPFSAGRRLHHPALGGTGLGLAISRRLAD
jgi:signal transduction histidine kinase